MPSSMTRPASPAARRLTALALAATTALVLSSCAVLDTSGSSKEPPRDEADGKITETADADVFAIKVGDCLNSAGLGEGEINTVPVVPCSDPHDGEVYAETTLPSGEFPGEDPVAQQADAFCYDQFSPFIGTSWEESTLDYYPLTPTEAGWKGIDDRLVQCVIAATDNVTVSFRGSQR